jgi:acetyl-CoA/propionyl-CoA carboxylase biotin carboxyl carrier protein
MLRALAEFEVEGIPTTIPFHQWVLDTEEFRQATVHTKWVEEALEAGRFTPPGASEPSDQPARGAPVHLMVEVDGHRVPVRLWGDHVRTPPPAPVAGSHAHSGAGLVTAPMQGTILDVKVDAGQKVAAGDVVAILEAMKMENHIAATMEGTVAEVVVKKGQVVETGQPLVVIE